MVRRMEWRPPLLYVNPWSYRVSATLKISQKCVKQQPKNERAVLCAVRAVRLFPSMISPATKCTKIGTTTFMVQSVRERC